MDYEVKECPFCGWEAGKGDMLSLHIESLHAEGQPYSEVGKAQASTSKEEEEGQYAECPIEGCDEILLLDEMDYHLELHDQEVVDMDHASLDHVSTMQEQQPHEAEGSRPGPSSSRHRSSSGHPTHRDKPSTSSSPSNSRQQSAISAWKNILNMPSSGRRSANAEKRAAASAVPGKRLGRSHLGKYAHEDRMPDWLINLLQKQGQVDQSGVIPVLEQLLQQSNTTKYAYLCHSCVHHVSRLKREGGFCGYRTIQMMTSFVIGAKFQGYQHFKKKIPSVFRIQDWIEEAWDAGINSQGRAETGGIRMTRKYIGTLEASAMFRLLEIPCETQAFRNPEPGKSETLLLEEVENYFMSGVVDPAKRIRSTDLPPIFFQHPGHSMLIVGFEKQKNGAKNLLVFDSMFSDHWSIQKLVRKQFDHIFPDMALKPYRRGTRYLHKYKAFELLRLRLPTDTIPES
ncbi:DUF1671-domain-containing protein [Coniochaeta ligniaria NRRL 30616]|uniref:DUF1671-domain-containing protein n=1 Tax=Coniochaeta ligniaria NRRL 30616 TaxID=1408157 RepID=A0A1J7IQY1_9PEZI|nr:DUF1671-domain-containing protein [Coniochaeta ligniaria NRRL 30616]